MNIELNVSPPKGLPFVVELPLQPGDLPAGGAVLVNKINGHTLPVQVDGAKVLSVTAAPAKGTWEVQAAESAPAVTLKVGRKLSLHLPEGLFSEYHVDEGARPFLWPVLGPGNVPLTRAFPMEEIEGETHDHPHHRSMWSAFDEVNGVNNWAETPGHGFTRHLEFRDLTEGPVFGEFTGAGKWTSAEDAPVLDETRTVRLYNAGANTRLLDYTLTLKAAYGDVTFNDTKEAGLLSIRVATSMDGTENGLITNSEGGIGEADCWGYKARWTDYSGPAGADKSTFGFTVFDHPTNPGHPTRWHVRDYGLFSANPFSTAAFGQGEASPFTLPAGESVTFRYRVLIHTDSANKENLESVWKNFVSGK
jgi:hypothetical protein